MERQLRREQEERETLDGCLILSYFLTAHYELSVSIGGGNEKIDPTTGDGDDGQQHQSSTQDVFDELSDETGSNVPAHVIPFVGCLWKYLLNTYANDCGAEEIERNMVLRGLIKLMHGPEIGSVLSPATAIDAIRFMRKVKVDTRKCVNTRSKAVQQRSSEVLAVGFEGIKRILTTISAFLGTQNPSQVDQATQSVMHTEVPLDCTLFLSNPNLIQFYRKTWKMEKLDEIGMSDKMRLERHQALKYVFVTSFQVLIFASDFQALVGHHLRTEQALKPFLETLVPYLVTLIRASDERIRFLALCSVYQLLVALKDHCYEEKFSLHESEQTHSVFLLLFQSLCDDSIKAHHLNLSLFSICLIAVVDFLEACTKGVSRLLDTALRKVLDAATFAITPEEEVLHSLLTSVLVLKMKHLSTSYWKQLNPPIQNLISLVNPVTKGRAYTVKQLQCSRPFCGLFCLFVFLRVTVCFDVLPLIKEEVITILIRYRIAQSSSTGRDGLFSCDELEGGFKKDVEILQKRDQETVKSNVSRVIENMTLDPRRAEAELYLLLIDIVREVVGTDYLFEALSYVRAGTDE